MSIDTELLQNGTQFKIKMDGKFDFSKVQDFRESYQSLPDTVTSIVIDLSRTEYMDSSALGMLLNMQKSMSDKSMSYEITNCQDQVARILKISRFDKKFKIS